MNREQKEFEIRRIWNHISNEDRAIFCHALLTYSEQKGSIAGIVASLDADEFDAFYADCVQNLASREAT